MGKRRCELADTGQDLRGKTGRMLERERKEDREPEGSPAMSGRICGGSQGLLAERKTGRARARGTVEEKDAQPCVQSRGGGDARKAA